MKFQYLLMIILYMKLKINFFNEIIFIYFDKTALFIAIEKGNTEIVDILLSRKNTDINAKNILII